MSDLQFTAISDERLELGEGAAWYDGTFWLVDLLTGRVLCADPARSYLRDVLRLDVPVGAAAPTTSGGLVLAAGTGIAVARDGDVTWLDRPEDGAPTPMRMNDGTTDPQGRFWATSMAYDGTAGAGSVYRVGADGEVVRVLGDLTIPNGPAFTPEGDRLYLADSARGVILTFRVDAATGQLSERAVFARVTEGSPDGMTVDAEGFVWSAVWGAARLHRYAPDGRLVDVIPVPARQPTSVALSPSTSRTLMVTTATYDLDGPADLDGCTLVAAVDVAGVAAPPFLV